MESFDVLLKMSEQLGRVEEKVDGVRADYNRHAESISGRVRTLEARANTAAGWVAAIGAAAGGLVTLIIAFFEHLKRVR